MQRLARPSKPLAGSCAAPDRFGGADALVFIVAASGSFGEAPR
jgi:hypothetical protein